MTVGDWNKLGAKQRGKIMTVDPTQRRVELLLKDGAMVQVSTWEVPASFRWPEEGEIWTIRREGGYWLLDERQIDTEEPFGLTDLPAGGVRIDSNDIRARDGRNAVVTDQTIASNGDAPIWDDTNQIWVPGPVGGGGGGGGGFTPIYGRFKTGNTASLVGVGGNSWWPSWTGVLRNATGFVLQTVSVSGNNVSLVKVPSDGMYTARWFGNVAWDSAGAAGEEVYGHNLVYPPANYAFVDFTGGDGHHFALSGTFGVVIPSVMGLVQAFAGDYIAMFLSDPSSILTDATTSGANFLDIVKIADL